MDWILFIAIVSIGGPILYGVLYWIVRWFIKMETAPQVIPVNPLPFILAGDEREAIRYAREVLGVRRWVYVADYKVILGYDRDHVIKLYTLGLGGSGETALGSNTSYYDSLKSYVPTRTPRDRPNETASDNRDGDHRLQFAYPDGPSVFERPMNVNLEDNGGLSLLPRTGADEIIVSALFAAFARGGELKVEYKKRDGVSTGRIGVELLTPRGYERGEEDYRFSSLDILEEYDDDEDSIHS